MLSDVREVTGLSAGGRQAAPRLPTTFSILLLCSSPWVTHCISSRQWQVRALSRAMLWWPMIWVTVKGLLGFAISPQGRNTHEVSLPDSYTGLSLYLRLR